MPRLEENLTQRWGQRDVIHNDAPTKQTPVEEPTYHPQAVWTGNTMSDKRFCGLPTIHTPYYHHYDLDIKQVAL